MNARRATWQFAHQIIELARMSATRRKGRQSTRVSDAHATHDLDEWTASRIAIRAHGSILADIVVGALQRPYGPKKRSRTHAAFRS
jgi:hypothetical protein